MGIKPEADAPDYREYVAKTVREVFQEKYLDMRNFSRRWGLFRARGLNDVRRGSCTRAVGVPWP